MNMHLVIQNTVAHFPGMVIQQIHYQNQYWRIRVAKDDMSIEFDMHETIRTPCVLEKKNLGFKSLSKFMNTFMEELDSMMEEEDPIPLAHD
jgi:hypothetical protein